LPAAKPARLPLILGSLVALALASTATSIWNDFTVDDVVIVQNNPRVQTLGGWWQIFRQPYWPPQVGAGLYRPLQILAFAIEWWIRPGSPKLFHTANVALYVVATLGVFWLARLLLPVGVAWLVAALFAVHPVHVEAVGNVVGQAELIVAVTFIAAAALFTRDRLHGELRPRTILTIAALYAIGCFTKEHALVLPIVLGAIELAIRRPATASSGHARPLALLGVSLALVALVYVGARLQVPGAAFSGSNSVMFPEFSWRVHVATALGVVPQYVRLLLWPAHLSGDYSPQVVRIAERWLPEMTLGIGIILLVAVLLVVTVRRDRTLFIGLAWTVITLAVPAATVALGGVLLAERMMLLPTVGALLAVGGLVALVQRNVIIRSTSLRIAGALLVAVVLAVGAVRSAKRQLVWRNNGTWRASVLRDAPMSVATRWYIGDSLVRLGQFERGERDLRAAIALRPYPELVTRLGTLYKERGRCADALPLFVDSARRNPRSIETRVGLVECLAALGRTDSARVVARGLRDDGSLKPSERARVDTLFQRVAGIATDSANPSR
jgi:hypothetical protein